MASEIKKMRNILSLIFLLVTLFTDCKQKPTIPPPAKDSLKISACGFITLNSFYFPKKVTSGDSSTYAIIGELLEATGMHLNNDNKNFLIARSEKLKNALAVTKPRIDGNLLFIQRYIIYDDAYMHGLLATCSPAAQYVIYAHEITHHLNGDSFMDKETVEAKRQRELAADSFAGFLCYKMSLFHHFTLDDCIKVYEVIGDSTDTKTHPNKKLREQTFSEGWSNSKQLLALSCDAAKALESNPLQAIEELAGVNAQQVAEFKNSSLASIRLESSGIASGEEAFTLRGDTSVFIKSNDVVIPAKQKHQIVSQDMTITTTKKMQARDTSDYIVDKRHIIWARYPNGVPYIAGYTVKK